MRATNTQAHQPQVITTSNHLKPCECKLMQSSEINREPMSVELERGDSRRTSDVLPNKESSNEEKLDQLSLATSIHMRSIKSNRRSPANMKLNLKLPKATKPNQQRVRPQIECLKSLLALALFVTVQQVESRHQIQQEPSISNEISQQPPTNFSHLTRDVTNLRMIPDLRSIRLRWNYVQPNVSHVRPASFEIRYCELTSWMTEIKCRHRNVPVEAAAGDTERTGMEANATIIGTARQANDANSTVIHHGQQQPPQSDAVVRPLASELAETTSSSKLAMGMISDAFETQIYDLRALTNYTFDVHVARFVGERSAPYPTALKMGSSSTARSSQTRPARRLDLSMGAAGGDNPNELLPWNSNTPASGRDQLFRAETKPFQAEALKCLANSSEVLVNTGRYFGGRISVESQPFDARCQLMGNKSSSQTSYLFRIDHDICRSKVIDSNRIETMILVHENKDILTHNTARFLVQCNIQQKSFTVKASVSLPKVNSLNQQTRPLADHQNQYRPATITMLSGRPSPETGRPNQAPADKHHVRLGSMPGVYRLIRAGASTTTDQAEGDSSKASSVSDKLVTGESSSSSSSARRSKELLTHETRNRDNGIATGDNYQLELPKPVEVSSRILFVTRANSDELLPPVARQRGARLGLAQTMTTTTSNVQSLPANLGAASLSSSVEVDDRNAAPARILSNTHNQNHKSPQQQLQMAANDRYTGDEDEDSKLALASSMAQPIIMTNNHRVVGEFLPLAQVATNHHAAVPRVATPSSTKEITTPTDYSIRYSAAKVDDYTLEHGGYDADNSRTANTTTQQPVVQAHTRSRSGRMRHIVSTPPSSSFSISSKQQAVGSRMGEALPQQDLIGAESAPPGGLIWPQARDSGSTSRDAPEIVGDGQVAIVTNHSSASPTLAQNITGALIRWSLKTLGNLARKSLESLVDEHDSTLAGHDNLTTNLMNGPKTERDDRVRDGFLVDDGASRKATSATTTTTRNQPPTTSSTTSASGLQQPLKAATQSADLIQSRGPHHLEPPPMLLPGQTVSRQATTVALVTASHNLTPTSVPSTTTTTTRAPIIQQQHQRIHKSHNNNNHRSHAEQQHSARIRSHHGEEGTLKLPASEGQPRDLTSSSSSFWPLVLLLGLIGSVALLTLVIYLVAFSSSSPQMFKPASRRHYNDEMGSTRQQPRLGFLSQLNDAIYRHHHSTTPDRCPDSLVGIGEQQTSKRPSQLHHSQVNDNNNTIDKLLAKDSDVRSPSVHRRRSPNDEAQSRDSCIIGASARPSHSLTSPGGSESGSVTTRSTSAASVENYSTNTGSSLEVENYCKNHEQFVYSDYLLLNKSDCLSNDCGRESFA